jgi:hypothetical protein
VKLWLQNSEKMSCVPRRCDFHSFPHNLQPSFWTKLYTPNVFRTIINCYICPLFTYFYNTAHYCQFNIWQHTWYIILQCIEYKAPNIQHTLWVKSPLITDYFCNSLLSFRCFQFLKASPTFNVQALVCLDIRKWRSNTEKQQKCQCCPAEELLLTAVSSLAHTLSLAGSICVSRSYRDSNIK